MCMCSVWIMCSVWLTPLGGDIDPQLLLHTTFRVPSRSILGEGLLQATDMQVDGRV